MFRILKLTLNTTRIFHYVLRDLKGESFTSRYANNVIFKIPRFHQLRIKDYNRGNGNSQNKNRLRLCLYSSFTLFGLLGNEKDEDQKVPDLIMTIKRSILLIQKGEFKKAEQMLHIALQQAQTIKHYDAITYIYDIMANLAFDVGDYKKAEKLFISVMQRLVTQGATENDMRIIHISLKLAKLYETQGDLQKALDGYKFCMKQLQDKVAKESESEDVLLLWGMTLDWYGKMLLSQSKHAEAFENFAKAYEICVNVNGYANEQTVVLLNDLGAISHLKGEYDEAIKFFTEAAEIGENLPEMIDLSTIYINLGNVQMTKGLYDEAEKSCKKGLNLSKARQNDETLEEAKICLQEIRKLLSQA